MTELISTALPYVNGPPHIGHAQELVIADVLARHARGRGRTTHLLSGSDENSLKNVLAAEAAREPTADFVARHAKRISDLAAGLDVQLDDFIRTSVDPRHAPVVERLWRDCDEAGDIYQADYSGLYCVGCEQFYTPTELADGRCPEHLTEPEDVRESNYFFRLSRFQDELVDRIESGRLQILPAHRRNEVLAFLREPLQDLSISRSRERAHGWGLPVPDDPSQVIYVWFDALTNYLSARGEARWKGADRVTHVIGKGVSRFHCVYWPAMLLSAGRRLPDRIWVHGYVTVDGGKISKSLGGAIDPFEALDMHGTDPLRYFLLRHVGSHRDADFSWPRLAAAYEHELANQLGNLVSRTIALARKTPGLDDERPGPLDCALAERIDEALDGFAVHRGIEEIWRLVEATNAFVSEREPWKLVGAEKAVVVGSALATLETIGAELAAFLPTTAARLVSALSDRQSVQLFPRS